MPNKPPSKKSSAPAEADARRWLHELEKQNAQLRSARDAAEALLEQLRVSEIRYRRISSSNLKLKQEVIRRQKVEEVLQKTEQRQSRLLEQARRQRRVTPHRQGAATP